MASEAVLQLQQLLLLPPLSTGHYSGRALIDAWRAGRVLFGRVGVPPEP